MTTTIQNLVKIYKKSHDEKLKKQGLPTKEETSAKK